MCDFISSQRIVLVGVGRKGCWGEKLTSSLPSSGSFCLFPLPEGLSWAMRRVVGSADFWLWVPGSELSQSHRVLKSILVVPGSLLVLLVLQEKACRSPHIFSHLFLPRHIPCPQSPCGAGHVEPSWLPVWGGDSLLSPAWTRSLVQVSSIAGSLHTPLSSLSDSHPSPVALPPVLVLQLLPELLCQAPLWPLARQSPSCTRLVPKAQACLTA